jgi:hypothetical protein
MLHEFDLSWALLAKRFERREQLRGRRPRVPPAYFSRSPTLCFR